MHGDSCRLALYGIIHNPVCAGEGQGQAQGFPSAKIYLQPKALIFHFDAEDVLFFHLNVRDFLVRPDDRIKHPGQDPK